MAVKGGSKGCHEWPILESTTKGSPSHSRTTQEGRWHAMATKASADELVRPAGAGTDPRQAVAGPSQDASPLVSHDTLAKLAVALKRVLQEPFGGHNALPVHARVIPHANALGLEQVAEAAEDDAAVGALHKVHHAWVQAKASTAAVSTQGR